MNDRIKKIRRELNLTQQEFAAKIGSVQNTITGYETGRRVPSNQVVSLICRVFHVNERWLRSGEGEMFAPDPNNGLEMLAREKQLTQSECILIEKFINLKPETRAQILRYIQEVAAAISGCDAPADAHEYDPVAAAEAAYEKAFGFAQKTESYASNTTEGEKAG